MKDEKGWGIRTSSTAIATFILHPLSFLLDCFQRFPFTRWPRWCHGAVAGLGAALLALALMAAGWLDPWEARTYDWRAKVLAGPGKASDQIRVILLDQNSLDWGQAENGLTWPWPREIYGAIIDFCQRAGARAIGLDVLFTEPSTYGQADDLALAEAAGRFGKAAAAVFAGSRTGSAQAWPADVPAPFSGALVPEPVRRMANSVPRAVFPIAPLAKTAAVLGNVQLKPDADGIFRGLDPLVVFDGRVVPALGLAVFGAAHSGAGLSGDGNHLDIGGHRLPLDGRGRCLLRFRGPSGTHTTISAAAVLQAQIRHLSGQSDTGLDPALFKDKYVLFGFSAPGLLDLRSVPTAAVFAGVEVHATLLDNLLSGDFIRPLPVGITVALALVLALGAGIAMSLYTRPVHELTVTLAVVVAPVAMGLGAYQGGWWLPIVVLEAGAFAAVLFALAVNYAVEGRQKRFIKTAFQQYLSPAVIEQIIAHPERLKLGGERRVLSIFFSDLQGFTTISEGLDPEALTGFLNDYLTAMTEIIHREGGTIDKYEGDAIIAFWNAPLPVADHADRALAAAMACQAELARLRPALRQRLGCDLFMRIGIHSGQAVVGNMGSTTRFDYTMLGDSVNLASRLEGANKQFGTYTMVSGETVKLLTVKPPLRELARLAVKGRARPVTVHEPLDQTTYLARKDSLDTFGRGLGLFYQGRLAEAAALFVAIAGQDPAAAAYLKRCQILSDGVDADWQGVWVADSK